MTQRQTSERADNNDDSHRRAPAGRDERGARGGRGAGTILLAALLVVALGVLGMALVKAGERGLFSVSAAAGSPQDASGSSSSVYTTAHRTFLGAVRDYFDIYPTPVQPIAFNHKIHLAKGMKCLSCHAGAAKGPDAGVPSVTFCMACHQVIATNNPEIQKLAAYAAKGEDVPWQRVNWFYPAAHVRFWHAPHIRAGVDCTTCHGNISQETVAVRSENLTMQFCLNCHRQKEVSVDCTTCHD